MPVDKLSLNKVLLKPFRPNIICQYPSDDNLKRKKNSD